MDEKIVKRQKTGLKKGQVGKSVIKRKKVLDKRK